MEVYDADNDLLYKSVVFENNIASAYAQKEEFKAAEEALLKSLDIGKGIGSQIYLQNLKDLAGTLPRNPIIKSKLNI